MERHIEHLILFLIGGISYYCIEILWSGSSHPAMIIVGGICFVTIGLIDKYYFASKRSILIRLSVSSLIITILELISGIILNLGLGLDIWDYSSFSFNVMGQICLRYSMYWFFLSLPAIIFYNYIEYWLFGESKPDYTFIKIR